MAKKKKASNIKAAAPAPQQGQPQLSPELKALKDNIDKFTKKALEKFDKYILGTALLPPDPNNKEQVNLLVLIDDSDSQRMTKEELKTKLGGIISEMAKEVDPKFVVQTWILSELWGDCYDGKYDKLKILATAQPFFDKGVIGACKVSEVHKQMVLEKFERYIVCYVAAGALFRGEGNPKSDIDVFVVIDDTDVKKMTRAELKDRLTQLVYDMVYKATEMTGVKRKLHVQTYLLTDFWDSVKDANPVIFTFLRDGIPFFDRGMYVPWRQLLLMGKIKPSAESIDMFQKSGEQFLDRAKKKFLHAGVEDAYYAILNPSQAALMAYGLNPATPKETARLIREVFVKKEKILESEYADIIEEQVKIWKKFEYDEIKSMDGAEADRLIKNVEKYLERIQKLYEEIEKQKLVESSTHVVDSVIAASRDVLKMEGVEKVAEDKLLSTFEKELIKTKKLDAKILKDLKKLLAVKKDYSKGKLSKQELERVKIDARHFVREMVARLEEKRAKDLKRAKFAVKYGDKVAEVIMFEKEAYIIHDASDREGTISQAKVTDKGLKNVEPSSLEDLEKSLASENLATDVRVQAQTFVDLGELLGNSVEILITN